MTYAKVDDAVHLIRVLGMRTELDLKNAYRTELDLKNAYRIVLTPS